MPNAEYSAVQLRSSFPPFTLFLASEVIEDTDIFKLLQSTCKVLNLTLEETADAFGDFWINSFAIDIYKPFYLESKSAKEFLLNMNNLHDNLTKIMPDACPPKFTYSWKNKKTLIMTYSSKRGLIDIMVGLTKGVGTYFKENLKVIKLGNDKVKIIFE